MFAAARDLFFHKWHDRNVSNTETTLIGEACLLHLRSIVDFFYPTTVRGSDVIASDYAGDWDTKRPKMPPILDLARNRTHKELAHLTSARKDGLAPDKDWNFQALTTAISGVIEAFISDADLKLLPPAAIAELKKAGTMPLLLTGAPVFNSSGPRPSSP